MRNSRVRYALLALWVAAAPAGASGSDAHFWLSTAGSGDAGPAVAAVSPTVGETVRMYVWGRPTDARQFEALSLDVVATSGDIDFVDGSFHFYNEIDGSTDRFQFINDSSTEGPGVESDYGEFELGLGGVEDAIRGLNGFTLTAGTPRGPGPVCGVGESDCEVVGDAAPAWLIAHFDVTALTAGSTGVHLQIGERGVSERTLADGDYDLGGAVGAEDQPVWAAEYGSGAFSPADGNGDGLVDAADYTVWRDHVGDIATSLDLADTDVRFGVDAGDGVEPLHNALTDQQFNHVGDDPDATLLIVAPSFAIPEPASAVLVGYTLLISVRRRRPTGIS